MDSRVSHPRRRSVLSALATLAMLAGLAAACSEAPADPANDPAYREALPGRSDQDESVFFENAPK